MRQAVWQSESGRVWRAEFVGCSPSLSGALRVNPWSIDSIADGIYAAIKMNKADQMIRHEKHWAYVESHTVQHWARNFTTYLLQATEGHQRMSTYGLGLGLDTFRMIALDPTFRKLTHAALRDVYNKCSKRLILCDYDGTLVPTNQARPLSSPLSSLLRSCGRVRVSEVQSPCKLHRTRTRTESTRRARRWTCRRRPR